MIGSPSSSPDLSVVICTCNRASDLERALTSVRAQETAAFSFEIIVVDNGSTDNTPDVVRRAASLPHTTYLFEARPGLSHARNTGWRAMQSQVAVFLDDDAVAEPGWLAAVHRAFQSADASVGGIGGRIVPVWDAPRPHWLADRPMLALTMLDWSPAPKQIHDLTTEWLAGANMAFRRDALEAVEGFHPALGRSGRRALSSEDVFLQRQLQRVGFTLWYHPDMCVSHRVSASRLTPQWFRRRYFWQGVSDAVMAQIDFEPSARERWSQARRRTVSLLRRGATLLDVVRHTDDPVRFEQACWMWIECGHIAGLLGAGRI